MKIKSNDFSTKNSHRRLSTQGKTTNMPNFAVGIPRLTR